MLTESLRDIAANHGWPVCDEAADKIEQLERDLLGHSDYELGKNDGWEACETCHGIVDGVSPHRRAIEAEVRAEDPLDESHYCPDCETLQAKVVEQGAEIDRQNRAYEAIDEQRNRDFETIAQQAALIEKCEKALLIERDIYRDNDPDDGETESIAEALAAIAAHRSQSCSR